MKAIALVDRFGVDALTTIEIDTPSPAPGEVLVRIDAVALNYRDLQVIDGVRPLQLPLIPLSDAAGEVVALGEGASAFAVGDRVMPTFIQGWIAGPHPQIDPLPTLGAPLPGVCRPYAAFREESLVRVPGHLSAEEAATLPCAAVSAWNALFVATHVGPGQTVLVQGTGGVSMFALQFAKCAGARVVVVSGSEAKMARARALGADHVLNYRETPEWGAAVRALVPEGVHTVVEVGGEATVAQSIVALRNAGHISYVGFLSGTTPKFDLGELSRKSIRVVGIRVGNRSSFEDMCRAIEAARLRPAVDSVHPIADLGAALSRLRQGRHFGKIALRIDEAM